jgi:hypothetical protein
MVCTQTLAFISLRYGIYTHIEQSYDVLPGRLAADERAMQEDHRGLWGTSPPKAMANVVESVVGAINALGAPKLVEVRH